MTTLTDNIKQALHRNLCSGLEQQAFASALPPAIATGPP